MKHVEHLAWKYEWEIFFEMLFHKPSAKKDTWKTKVLICAYNENWSWSNRI
jgi:hypothetical protein